MRIQSWSECLQATRDFAGHYAGDFDIEALAEVLFDYDASTDAYVEREYTDDDIQALGINHQSPLIYCLQDYRRQRQALHLVRV